MFQPRHQVGAQWFDVDAVERIEPHQQVVLDRGRHARPRGPVPERGPPFRRERIDQLVRLAGLQHLAALDMAAVAKFGEFPINLLVVSLPEKSNGVVERLGELIARHRTFGQAGKDRVTKRHDAGPFGF